MKKNKIFNKILDKYKENGVVCVQDYKRSWTERELKNLSKFFERNVNDKIEVKELNFRGYDGTTEVVYVGIGKEVYFSYSHLIKY